MQRRKFIGLGTLAVSGLLLPVKDLFGGTFRASKDWKVYILNATHGDIGWYDMPASIMAQLTVYLDTAVSLCEKTMNEAEDLRYIYTIEHAWIVDYYEKNRTPEQFNRLISCIKRGQIEVGALYASVHTDLCGHEELARLPFYAALLRKRLGINVNSAMLNDVSEGYTMGLPQLLKKNGITGICFGPGVKAAARGIVPDLPRVFYWQTNDGSKILFAWTPGFWTYGTKTAGFHGQSTFEEFDRLSDYPCDAFFRQGGGDGDLRPVDPSLTSRVKKFREEWPNNQFKLSTMGEFFSYIEKNFSGKIPVIKGDNPQSWADGTISLALETGLHKRNQHDIITAECLAALFPGKEYPVRDIQTVYNNMNLYSDHTWGLEFSADGKPGNITKVTRGSISDGLIVYNVPAGTELTSDSKYFDLFRRHWQAKKDYVYVAQKLTNNILSLSLNELKKHIKVEKPGIAVWNPLSFTRTDIVRLEWTLKEIPSVLIDKRDGNKIPCQIETDENNQPILTFIAPSLPPLGYAVFETERGINTELPKKIDSDFIENQFYKIKIDPSTGTLLSIFDKELNKDIIDNGSTYSFNQYIHNDVTAGFDFTVSSGITDGEGIRYTPDLVEKVECYTGPVFSCFKSVAKLTSGPAPATVRRTVRLYNNVKKIDILNVVDKKESLFKEQIYFAFPFEAGCDPTVQIELPYAVMQFDKDILPGCWRGYNSVQNFVRLTGSGMNITWSSPEAPVATFGGINSNHWDPEWHKTFVPTNAHIYSYIMSNMWNCNYPLFQGGKVEFPYSFISGKSISLAESVNFGWANAHPLVAMVVSQNEGRMPAAEYSALNVDQNNVIVSALKRAEDGNGFIIRLYETNQNPATKVKLNINFTKLKSANLCMISEENQELLPILNNSVTFTIKANELVSIRIV
jgi:alpha-mannosidase